MGGAGAREGGATFFFSPLAPPVRLQKGLRLSQNVPHTTKKRFLKTGKNIFLETGVTPGL